MRALIEKGRRHVFQVRYYVFDPLNKGQYLRRLTDYLRWHIFFKYRGKKWLLTLENGTKTIVYPYPDHDAGELDIWSRNNDYYETKFVREYLEKSAYIFDIGCNVGNRTWVLSDLLSGALLIDAGDIAVARAEENRALNNLSEQDYPILLSAAGEEVGIIKFSNLGGASTNNSVMNGENIHFHESYREVPMTTVDAEVRKRGRFPSFIKIDAEGYDLNVLKGAQETLKSGHVRFVKFERNKEIDLGEVRKFFEGHGWDLFVIKKTGELSRKSSEIEKAANLFAAPKTDILKYWN